MAIEFNTYLKDEDWMPTMGGWRCEALLIPGAKFEALYHDGSKADPKDFNVERHIVRWAGASRPKDLLITLSLAKDLPQLEQEKLRLEREKLNLEHKKTFLENRWKVIAAIGAALSSVLTFGATYLVNQPRLKTSTQRPYIHTYAKELRGSEDACINSLSKGFDDYGLKNINKVQGGIYGEQGTYNVFVACDIDLNSVFLAVSGSDSSRTREIREDIKRLLP